MRTATTSKVQHCERSGELVLNPKATPKPSMSVFCSHDLGKENVSGLVGHPGVTRISGAVKALSSPTVGFPILPDT